MADENSEPSSSGFSFDPARNYDEATMEQQRQIEKEVVLSQHLVGNREIVSTLKEEFAEDVIYQQKTQDLQKKYSHFRRTRGDGNCFYRAFGFSYFEKLLQDREEYDRFKDIASKSKAMLLGLGFPQFTLEDFHDVFMEVIEKVGSQCSVDDLLATFNDQGYSDYLVVYLRLIVSGHLQKEADFYANFVEGGRTVQEFCSQEVEPMGKESDHIHIIALTSATGVPVQVEYMDRGGADGSVKGHIFPEGATPKIHLLYKPGHYELELCTSNFFPRLAPLCPYPTFSITHLFPFHTCAVHTHKL